MTHSSAAMDRRILEEVRLNQHLSLIDYLRQQNSVAQPAGHGPELVGLCLLHPDTRTSFYVNGSKNLFYWHGCGQGGDLLRVVQLSRQLSFRQSLARRHRELHPDLWKFPVLLT